MSNEQINQELYNVLASKFNAEGLEGRLNEKYDPTSNKNCEKSIHCGNCENCEGCAYCLGCKCCKNCKSCNSCIDCINCELCENCVSCGECSYLHNSKNCKNCTGSNNLENCINVTDSFKSKNCNNSHHLAYCTNCSNCNHIYDGNNLNNVEWDLKEYQSYRGKRNRIVDAEKLALKSRNEKAIQKVKQRWRKLFELRDGLNIKGQK